MADIVTKTIGLKEFRSNVTTIWKHARKYNIRYIVLHHAKPIFEVNPISENSLLEKLALDIRTARQQAKNGKVYSETEVYKFLGM